MRHLPSGSSRNLDDQVLHIVFLRGKGVFDVSQRLRPVRLDRLLYQITKQLFEKRLMDFIAAGEELGQLAARRTAPAGRRASGTAPVASIGRPFSCCRRRPEASNRSRAKPSGLIVAWHDWQASGRVWSSTSLAGRHRRLQVRRLAARWPSGGGRNARPSTPREINTPRRIGEVSAAWRRRPSNKDATKCPPAAAAQTPPSESPPSPSAPSAASARSSRPAGRSYRRSRPVSSWRKSDALSHITFVDEQLQRSPQVGGDGRVERLERLRVFGQFRRRFDLHPLQEEKPQLGPCARVGQHPPGLLADLFVGDELAGRRRLPQRSSGRESHISSASRLAVACGPSSVGT